VNGVIDVSIQQRYAAHTPMKNQPFLGPSIKAAYALSGLASLGIVVSSAASFVSRGSVFHGQSGSVLVSPGADVANLMLVAPLILCCLLLSMRGSLIGLLLLPGGLLYALYAYVPYLIGGPFTALLLVYVATATFSSFGLAVLLASVDLESVRRRLAGAPASQVGIVITAIAVLAYVGLIDVFARVLGNPPTAAAVRGHWVADWLIGTPTLLAGGVLLWRRAAIGYFSAAGLLLVSGLGGAAFAIAAVVDNAVGILHTEFSTIAIHVAISAVSLVLLVLFLRLARAGDPLKSRRDQ